MNGVYIHIPFCTSKCNYCNFFSVASKGHVNDFEQYVASEIELRNDYLDDKRIDTIYFGGGTPTLLSIKQLEAILKYLRRYYMVDSEAEITIEANPDTLSFDYLKGLKEIGFNRISIGIQSFNDTDLAYLGRKHNTNHAIDAIANSHNVGLSNISIDLIYNIPTQSMVQLEQNLKQATSLGVNHISAYSLTIEENTLLCKNIKSGKLPDITDNNFTNIFNLIHCYLTENGFRHYEVSNFAAENAISQHNSKYWNNTPYIGLGPSAHSYDGTSREWNVSSISQYKESLDRNKIVSEKELLTPINHYNEILMTQLRTDTGVELAQIKERFEDTIYQQFIRAVNKNMQYLTIKDRCTVKPEYWNILDSIILDFIII